jgi:hypothetical protein
MHLPTEIPSSFVNGENVKDIKTAIEVFINGKLIAFKFNYKKHDQSHCEVWNISQANTQIF